MNASSSHEIGSYEIGSYEIGRVPRTIVGVGSIDRLGEIVDSLDGRRAVLVVDGAVADLGVAQRALQALGAIRSHVHIVPGGEPTVESVDVAADAVRDCDDAVVIGIGGGSALDIAKQAAVVAAGSSGVERYLMCANPFVGRRPIVAIPTTSGTGSEATRTCIVADRLGQKVWTWGDEMLPDVVVLDPTVAVTMPHAVTVGTGLDAFVHAIEACSGQRCNSIATASSQRALGLVVEHLPRVSVDGSDVASRQAMQEAAYLAGIAIDNCGTGIAHSIGHALGSLYHVPHGVSVAVGLLAALQWNLVGAPAAYVAACGALGLDGDVEAIPSVFENLCRSTGLRDAITFGANLSAVDIAATMNAVENQPMLSNNARPVSDDDRFMLAERAVAVWSGVRA